MITKEQLKEYQKLQDQIHEFASDFVQEFGFNSPSVEGVELEDGMVSVTVSEGCMGHYESNWYSFPIEYLWDEHWYKTEKDKIAEANMKKLKEKAEKDKIKKEEDAKKEYERFLELKEKYEDDEPYCPPHSNSRNCV